MKGHLSATGMKISEKTLRKTMPTAQQDYHQRRQNNSEKLKNPPLYSASGFGDKLHIDQNEKHVMFGVTHVIAVDGFSKKIVASSTMPVKNNLTIYRDILK